MKNIYKIAAVIFVSAIMSSCTKHEVLDFHVDEPASFEAQKEIDSYDALKSYVKRDAQPDFKFGAAVSLTDYLKKGVMYRLINSNFDEIAIGYEMKHGAVVKANGTLDLANVKDLLKVASAAGMSVYGHTLCWHSNQNATYLNSIIAPTIIPGNGPALEPNLIPNSDFEAGNANGWGGWGNGSTRGISANGQGYGGAGYSLYMTNPKVVNSWEAQTPYDFSTPFQSGSVYKLSFYVKGSVAGSASVGFQETVSYGSDDFGSFPVTTEWKLVELEKTVTKGDRTRFIFSFGAYAGTINLDNISLRRLNPNSGEQSIEKTAAEKKVIIDHALDYFISGMVDTCKSYVKAWDVVNEPMDDAKPSELKSGIGKTLKPDEFYWQDYLGKDYAVRAFQLARAHGNTGDLHFINDYNLEYNLDKCKGLIDYVKYIESKGAKVDGIGTQMHIDATSNKANIDQMFKLLAATGKLIKVSELDMGVGAQTASATAEQYAAQAAMYKYVIAKYFEFIPAAQRYGITIWSPLDSPKSSSWRAGEPIGLWTEGFVRKSAYIGVADGLAGK